jgi:hypothetical protein
MMNQPNLRAFFTVPLGMILSIELRTFQKDDNRTKISCVEIVSKDSRKFNFLMKDPPQCEQLKKHLRSCTFIDREKNSDLSHYVNHTFAHDFYTALLGHKLETNDNGQIIAC